MREVINYEQDLEKKTVVGQGVGWEQWMEAESQDFCVVETEAEAQQNQDFLRGRIQKLRRSGLPSPAGSGASL